MIEQPTARSSNGDAAKPANPTPPQSEIERGEIEARIDELELALAAHSNFHGEKPCDDSYHNFTYLYERRRDLLASLGEETK